MPSGPPGSSPASGSSSSSGTSSSSNTQNTTTGGYNSHNNSGYSSSNHSSSSSGGVSHGFNDDDNDDNNYSRGFGSHSSSGFSIVDIAKSALSATGSFLELLNVAPTSLVLNLSTHGNFLGQPLNTFHGGGIIDMFNNDDSYLGLPVGSAGGLTDALNFDGHYLSLPSGNIFQGGWVGTSGVASIVNAHSVVRNSIDFHLANYTYLEQEFTDLSGFSTPEMHTIRISLAEIALTPEGQKLIQDSVTINGGNPIALVKLTNPGGSPGLAVNFTKGSTSGVGIVIDFEGLTDFEIPTQIGTSMAISVQRLLVHEMSHIALGHVTDPEQMQRDTLDKEFEVISFTNEFMAKYYNESPRALNHGAYLSDNTEITIAKLNKEAVFGAIQTKSNSSTASHNSTHLNFNSTEVNAATGYARTSHKDDLIKGSPDVTIVFNIGEETQAVNTSMNVNGGNGHDFIVGTNHNDRLIGGNGNDTLLGMGGKDVLAGNDGNDRIEGGIGNDKIYGGGGADLLFGQEGHDIMHGGTGHDSLFGGNGNDKLYGNSAHDYLSGGSGNDKLYGGSGNDILFGDDGHDKLYGGGGNDIIHGGSGNDVLEGYFGRDTLIGGQGNDKLYGGQGADTFVLSVSNEHNGVKSIDHFGDFNQKQGDVIEIRDVLFDYDSNDDITEFLRINSNGGNRYTLQINEDGKGNDWNTYATITSAANITNEEALLNLGDLVIS
ncbi:MAG: type I secretion C-terminal target domain-containing protein [Alphaproteobacteria bacterium]|nr:type I secretion C-terminal target domain-containing protein [Alphaproteobacteria bacterium]